jgi:branched-chain amino acid transport system ATP-binding protein
MNNWQLEIKDIDVFYGALQVLWGISLRIEKSEIITLIGANGAGKSTTINAISGILKPSRGEIIFEGTSISSLQPKKIVEMGIAQVPEGRRVFPNLTVLENLRLGAYLQNNSKEIDTKLQAVYQYFPILKEREKQLAGSLSGGEQQMLAIGRALMTSAKLLLMDEPTMGLSPLLCKEIAKMIKTINGTGMSIFLVEQNVMVALGVANRGYLMETGRIIKEGEGKKLLASKEVKEVYLGG